jgi:RNA ligase
MKYDLNAFEDMVRHGYLRKTETEDLVLYGYTDQCTFARAWDTKYTRDARGIIFEKKTGRLVAKPFPKFFNLGEMEEVSLLNLPKEPYEVFEKCDGSLGIIYYYGGKWNVATRGSFNSEQAVKGAEILKRYNVEVLPTYCTFLVEIIYPENKIIVDYKGEEKLVMLGAYSAQTQEEADWEWVTHIAKISGIPRANKYEYTIEQMIEMQKTMPKDEEGFVVRFESGARVKIKGHEYLRIAKIISQLSPLSLWEGMELGQVKNEYLSQVPEEFQKEIEPIIEALENQYSTVLAEIKVDVSKVMKLPEFTSPLNKEARKAVGLYLHGKHDLKHPSAMFLFLNSQDAALDYYIMKQIRPTGNVLSGVQLEDGRKFLDR